MYYLKLFDKNLLSFGMDNKLGLEITDIKVLEENRKIFPINLVGIFLILDLNHIVSIIVASY